MAVREGCWDCPTCAALGQRGRDVSCTQCGSPRPKGVRFYLPDDAPEVTDAEELRRARAGADWVCLHCAGSARASGGACPGCGAPRGSSPTQQTREYGMDEVPRAGGAPPPRQPVAAPRRKRSFVGRVVLGLVAVAVGFCAWSNRTRQVEAEVAAKEWERTVQVEEYRTVTESGWSLPGGGTLIRSYRDVRDYRQGLDHYETRSRQVSERVQVGSSRVVCGQRDNGNGYFEDVYCNEPQYETRYRTETYQEPIYRQEPIYDTKYEYRIKRWVPDQLLRAAGDTSAPVWPSAELNDAHREGEKKQRYVLTFHDGDGEVYTSTGHRVGEPIRLRVKGDSVEVDTTAAGG